MKFAFTSTAPKAKAKVCEVSAEDLHLAQLAVQDSYQKLVDTGAECNELFMIVDNIAQVSNAVHQHGIKGLEVLGTMTEGSLEAFIGAEAMAKAKLAEASLENKFTDAVKNVWAKVKEWFARLYDWFRKMFFTMEGELKHLEGMVDAKNDANFNPDTEYEDPVPTKMAFMALLKASNIVTDETEKVAPDLIKFLEQVNTIDFSKMKPVKDGEGPDESTAAELSKVEAASKEWETKAKATMDKINATLQADPILKDTVGTIEGIAEKKDPIEILKAVNSSFIRSGKASDLGYKSGADIRQVVTEFAKAMRGATRMEPTAKKCMAICQQLTDKFMKFAEGQGMPADVTKVVRIYMNLYGKLLNNSAKINRWIIMYVTRAVRRMYK